MIDINLSRNLAAWSRADVLLACRGVALAAPKLGSKGGSTRSRVLFLLATLLAGLGVMLATSALAQTFTTLHTFTASRTNSSGLYYINSDGAYPQNDGLILSGSTLYGTAGGGAA